YVVTHVKPHHSFERQGQDLITINTISLVTACLGGETVIETIDGKKIKMNIPPGTESEKIFRMSEQGLPHLGAFGRGDLHVIVKIDIPKKLSKKAKSLLEDLKSELN